MSTFDDRDVDRRVELVLRVDGEADDDRDRGEQEQLPPALEPERAAVAELDEVVEEADRAAARTVRKRTVSAGSVNLESARNGSERAEQDQQAAHHRRSLLDHVAGRAVLADRLAELVPAQELDELRADHDRDRPSRSGRR